MNGFTDLRPNIHYQSQNAEESFWPSFTDLMMVVVMIFLVTTSALYIRNWQLVQEMSAMIESERMAREMAQKSLAQRDSKDAILEKASADLMAASEVKNELQMNLFEAKESLRVLQMMRDALNARNARQTTELSAANSDKDQLLALLNAQTQRADSANAELTATRTELLALQQAQANSGQSINELKVDFDATTDRLVQLRADYVVLQGKYNKLLKPARSPKGRYVVTLRHGKSGGLLYYDFRLPSEDTYTRVTEASMHERLADVLADQGDQLYLKLVYPESSGLSYDEAYKFSNSVLSEYDYYYRNQPLSDQAVVE